MLKRNSIIRRVCATLAVAGAMFAATGSAVADKIHLKDGRVLEGTVAREGDGFVYFKVVVGGIENVQMFTSDQYTKLERDGDSPSDGEKPAATASRKNEPVSSPREGRGQATRVAILNFGAPGHWKGEIGDTVGIQISAEAWKKAIPLLEKDNVDVVVVRINSGGGMLLELERFWKVFQEEYKPRFRTVAWVESAISAAAMSPWCLEEFYMMPQGNIGACTGWFGALQAVKGWDLEDVLYMMEQMSRDAGRSPYIMRAMQIMEPLSCDINEVTGEVKWYQNMDGDHIVNGENLILTFNATDAVKYKFAKAIASDKQELARAMGLQEVEWVGQQAKDFIDDNMRDANRTSERLGLIYSKYEDTVSFAEGMQDEEKRGAFVGKARRLLAEMRRWVKVNENFTLLYGITDEWFMLQEERLDALVK